MSTVVRSVRYQLDDSIDRLLIVSDIHGFTRPLEVFDALHAGMSGRSQIVFNGDMCNPGLWPSKAIQWIRRNAGEFAVLGNHDEDVLQVDEAGSGDDQPHVTKEDEQQWFTNQVRDYLGSLRHRLVLSWRGKSIVLMHGHINANGKTVSWQASPQEQSKQFVESDTDLCVVSHTHYAYVRQNGRTICANPGSMSLPFIGVQDEHGLHLHSGNAEIGPDDDVRCSFLVVTVPDNKIQVEIARFDYDRQAELQDHLQTLSPLPSMLIKELLAMCSGIWKV